MPTQAIAGFVGKLYVSDDNITFVEVGELKDYEISIQTNTIDATSHASAGFEEYIMGLASWSGTIGAIYISSDSAQDKLDTAVANKSKLYFRFDPEGTGAGKDRWSGTGILPDWKLSSPDKDLAVRNVTVKGSGALVKSAQ